jgi:hypothetical protein
MELGNFAKGIAGDDVDTSARVSITVTAVRESLHKCFGFGINR